MADVDLKEFLDREVYPALFERLNLAFPEFGFSRKGNTWVATTEAARKLPGSPRQGGRVYCNRERPSGLKLQGGNFVPFLDLVSGGKEASGPGLPAVARKLAELAGVRFPDSEVLIKEAEQEAERKASLSAMEAVAELCRALLVSERGGAERAYLERCGLNVQAQKMLGLGVYPSVREVEKALRAAGHDIEAAQREGLLFKPIEGYVIFPAADVSGQLITLCGRWPNEPRKDKPRILVLPREGAKASLLYLDRACRAGFKELVLMAGAISAALLQAKGEGSVIGCMDAKLSNLQVETLVRYGVRSVTICPNPKDAGEAEILEVIGTLHANGIDAYIAPNLPQGKDWSGYILEHGPAGWREHIGRAQHAYSLMARALVERHMGGGWTSDSRSACLEEAMAFDVSVKYQKRRRELDLFFWPEIRRATGVNLDDVKARCEAAQETMKQEPQRGADDNLDQAADQEVRDEGLATAIEPVHQETGRLGAQGQNLNFESIHNVVEELEEHARQLERCRGQEFIGLPQRTLSKLDELTLGLRGLMLLAAETNVGKTALGIQIGLDTVIHNEDAAFLFVSLEMSRWDSLTRFKSRLAGFDWRTLALGSRRNSTAEAFEEEALRLRAEQRRMEEVEATLRKLGNRIRILDDGNFCAPTLEKVLDQVEDLKKSSGASRSFVLVDCLQVWPIPRAMAGVLRTDLDADEWRVEQMKQLRHALGAENAVLVISQAHKPWTDVGSLDDLAAVTGTARGAHTADMVFLLRRWTDEELGKGMEVSGKEVSEKGLEVRQEHAAQGYEDQRITIMKGRDGVQRGGLDLRFYFRQSRFEQM